MPPVRHMKYNPPTPPACRPKFGDVRQLYISRIRTGRNSDPHVMHRLEILFHGEQFRIGYDTEDTTGKALLIAAFDDLSPNGPAGALADWLEENYYKFTARNWPAAQPPYKPLTYKQAAKIAAALREYGHGWSLNRPPQRPWHRPN